MLSTTTPRPAPVRLARLLPLLLLLAALGPALPLRAMRPVAMVVGNGTFQAGPLKFAAPDAAKMADTLRDANVFVREYADTDLVRLRSALSALGRDVDQDGIAIFYYNGYAITYQGRNYLVPPDVSGPGIEAVVARCLPLEEVLTTLRESRARASIVLLDCVRPSPFYEQLAGVEPGLAALEPPDGILLAFAAQPGSYIMEQGPSLFTEHLTRQMANRKLPLTEALRRTRQHVRQLTSGAQVPWIVHGQAEEVFLTPQGGDRSYFGQPIEPQLKPAEPPPSAAAISAERLARETRLEEGPPPTPPLELRGSGALWEKAFRASPGELDAPQGGRYYAQPSIQSPAGGEISAGTRLRVEGYVRTREGVFWLTQEAGARYLAGEAPPWLLLDGMSGDESAVFAHLEKSPPVDSGPPPFARYVPGSAGFVYSPFAGARGVVDVRGFSPGDEVKCPYTGRLFKVP